MEYNKFSTGFKEVVINRMGKKPYSKELTNLILTRVDYETSFFHANADSLMSNIVMAFGGEEKFSELFYEKEFSNIFLIMGFLKEKYVEGEALYDEYVQYLGNMRVSNLSDGYLEDFLQQREGDYNYNKGIIAIYKRYGVTSFLNIMALDKKIKELEDKVKIEDELEEKREELEENTSPGGKVGLSKIMAIFKRD